MNNFKITNEGLQVTQKDERDFNLGGVFGYVDIKKVPVTDFVVAEPLIIKDQGDTDYCSSYALTAVSEDQEGVQLSPHFQFFATKQISGNPDAWGADLRSACKSAKDFGSIPSTEVKMSGVSRDGILDSKSWPDVILQRAKLYRKGSYFKVDGPYDLFDNIRCALWKHKEKKNTILTGIKWRYDWINCKDGIIREANGEGFGHAFKIFGQKVIENEIFLMAQLSNGTGVGDKGIFYLSREIVNKEIEPYGAYMLDDISREEAEFYLENSFVKKNSIFLTLFDFIINFFKQL